MKNKKLFCLIRLCGLVLCCSSLAPTFGQSAPAVDERDAAIEAINQIDLPKLKALLDKNPALVKAKDIGEDSDTLLHVTLRRGILSGGYPSTEEAAGLVAIIRLLIERKADVNARNNQNQTPLGYAAQWIRNVGAARVLLANGADMNDKLPSVRELAASGNALHTAVAAVNPEMVEFLIENKFDVNAKDGAGSTPLIINARTRGHTSQGDIAKVLIAAKAMVNEQDHYGGTALYYAANENSMIVQILLENGADPNLKTTDGLSAAQFAIGASDSQKTLRHLIKYKADLTIKDEAGLTLLHRASLARDTDYAETLLENKLDINSRDKEGHTPLQFAASNEVAPLEFQDVVRNAQGNEDMVELLLQRGADPNISNQEGKTALHIAAHEDRRVILRLLLENKGDPNAKDSEGATPLFTAIQVGSLRAAELLIKNGANPNSVDSQGQTPLHVATLYGAPAIVKILLVNKANPSIRDKEGKTALDWAKEYRNDEIAKTLLGQ